jgi:putative oxidoreductase
MRGIAGIHPGWALTVLRVATAIILIHAGWGKLSGGLEGPIGFFGKAGIPLPGLAAPFIMALELVGGALLLIGLAGRWMGLLFALQFVVATFYVKLPMAGWAATRIDVMILAAAIAIFIAGSGRLSVDEVWLERERY